MHQFSKKNLGKGDKEAVDRWNLRFLRDNQGAPLGVWFWGWRDSTGWEN